MSEERFEQLQTLTKEAAELLRLPENSERVVLLASLKLAHQVATERLVHGTHVDPAHLLALTETIAKMVPEAPPPAVTITIVQGCVGVYTCKHCGARNELPEGEYQPPPKPNPARTIDRDVLKDEPEAPRALSPPKPVH
jgi:hypothetical protein